jgi:hypothetical protein
VIELNPNYVVAYSNRANVYRDLKRYDMALIGMVFIIIVDSHIIN